jgi:hypothetical protein
VPSLERLGIEVVSIGLDVRNNTIQVGVHGLSDAKSARLLESYGGDLLVKEDTVGQFDECPTIFDCRPIKGGIAMRTVGGPPNQCTTGFAVRRSTGPIAILTAGHCNHLKANDELWLHDDDGFGRWLEGTWTAGATRTADVGLISIFSSDVNLMTKKNAMRNTNGVVTYVVGVASTLSQGMQVCREGATTSRDCGQLTIPAIKNKSEVPGGLFMWVTQSAQWDRDSLGGDSGGSTFYYSAGGTTGNVIALGTHVHSGTAAESKSWFSPIWPGRALYGSMFGETYLVCVNAACTD